MHVSLSKLAQLPDALPVLPGHDYGAGASTTIGKEKKQGMLKARSKEDFLMMHGAL
eukprot:CAMPEP_0119324932 /NCGR_PEP_ID=MMETSP1333-20130426/64536_1 /TAXON_ID=418940 /ORGANISM="Scyphosphaera apsteinii, Strain RCC1455" /LENGTH=55 /DNA_ID=CAMNT_0007332767 /DNA_START=83 /DNA_END=250 /DNA_ORIENTATION=-